MDDIKCPSSEEPSERKEAPQVCLGRTSLRGFHFAEQFNCAELDQVFLLQRQCAAACQPRVKGFARTDEIRRFLRKRKHKGTPSQLVRQG